MISFHEVREVHAILGERLLCIGCERRMFKFAFQSRDACELWATNLVTLINVAGFRIEGSIETAADDDDQMKRHKRKTPTRKRAVPMNML